MKILILLINTDFFCTSDRQLPFISQLSKEGIIYLFKKPKVVLIEKKRHGNNFDIHQANFTSALLLHKMAKCQKVGMLGPSII